MVTFSFSKGRYGLLRIWRCSGMLIEFSRPPHFPGQGHWRREHVTGWVDGSRRLLPCPCVSRDCVQLIRHLCRLSLLLTDAFCQYDTRGRERWRRKICLKYYSATKYIPIHFITLLYQNRVNLQCSTLYVNVAAAGELCCSRNSLPNTLKASNIHKLARVQDHMLQQMEAWWFQSDSNIEQVWESYGPWAICGPLSFLIQLAELEEMTLVVNTCMK